MWILDSIRHLPGDLLDWFFLEDRDDWSLIMEVRWTEGPGGYEFGSAAASTEKTMRRDYFKLEGKEVVPVADCLEWAQWYEKSDRQVARDDIDTVVVSTVFIGLDHQFGDGPPLLFETLVFGGKLDGQMDRYSTWDEATAGHIAMMVRVQLAGVQ